MKLTMLSSLKLIAICFLIFSLVGCDAFVRKFTRKPKKEQLPREEIVLVPEEYKPALDKEGQYRQYLLFWKSWQDELITSLLLTTNHKKKVGCAKEALKNFAQLGQYLKPEKQKKFDIYLNRMKDLRDAIASDIYDRDANINRGAAERLKMEILNEFSFPGIKDSLA